MTLTMSTSTMRILRQDHRRLARAAGRSPAGSELARLAWGSRWELAAASNDSRALRRKGEPLSWAGARRLLAEQILADARDDEALATLQREVLVPLEAELEAPGAPTLDPDAFFRWVLRHVVSHQLVTADRPR